MKWCGCPLCSIILLFFLLSHLPLFAGTESEPLPATHTIKWRVMKLYLRPGQMEGWEDREAKWEGGRVHSVSLWAKGNSIRPIIEPFFTSFHISPLFNSSPSCPFLSPLLFKDGACPLSYFSLENPSLFSELYSLHCTLSITSQLQSFFYCHMM